MFKNARFWRFTRPIDFTAEHLADCLRDDVIRPVGPQESARSGWVPVEGDMFVVDNGFWLIRLRTDERLLPNHVVNRYANDRAEALGRPVRRKEMDEIKDQVRLELLPKAFIKTIYMDAFIDPEGGTIVVDAASARKGEDLLSRLRKSLGSLPVRPPAVQHSPRFTMTGWLSGTVDAPDAIQLGEACEMHGLGEGSDGKVRVAGMDLLGEEVEVHINAGKQVVALDASHDGEFSAKVDEDMSLKSIKWNDSIWEDAEDDSAGIYLTSRALVRALNTMIKAFGGEYSESTDQ